MKNKKIKTIDIVFENCEVYSLTPKNDRYVRS